MPATWSKEFRKLIPRSLHLFVSILTDFFKESIPIHIIPLTWCDCDSGKQTTLKKSEGRSYRCVCVECQFDIDHFEHTELPARLPDYFSRSNKSNINQSTQIVLYGRTRQDAWLNDSSWQGASDFLCTETPVVFEEIRQPTKSPQKLGNASSDALRTSGFDISKNTYFFWNRASRNVNE